MKKVTLSALAAFAVAASAFAGSAKDFKQPVAQKFFQDTEFALDAFYSYNDTKAGYFVDGSGGGVGADFFFQRYFGVGVEGNWWNGASRKKTKH